MLQPPPTAHWALFYTQVLDAFHHGSVDKYPSVTTIIAESKQLQEFQDLFELYVSDYLVLTRCSEELLYLKSLWDMVRISSLALAVQDMS